MTKFLLNTFVMPLLLLALVRATWTSSSREEKSSPPPDGGDAQDLEKEIRANRRGDYYFAFFLTCKSGPLRGGLQVFRTTVSQIQR